MTDTDIAPLKDGLLATWSAGDYGKVAKALSASAEAFLSRLEGPPGARLLDIACGAGQVAIPAARAGAEVTGLDLVPAWIEQARARAEAEGLPARFEVGDAEALPFADAEFDVTLSLIGAMFAPRPERVAAEMLRVTRRGGRIAMGNWTAEGFVGGFFAAVAAHVPPPDMPSPLLWGEEETVRTRFGDGVSDLRMERHMHRFDYAMPPEEIAAHYAANFGPVNRAVAALDPAGRESLLADLAALWREANQTGRDDRVVVDAEILEVQATRA